MPLSGDFECRFRAIPGAAFGRNPLPVCPVLYNLPKDLPPKSTVHDYLTRWNYDGTIERMHHALYVQCREAAERQVSPTACVIDSQSVKSAEKGGAGSIRPVMTRGRRSRERSGTSWLIR